MVHFSGTGRVIAFTAEKVCVNFGTIQEPVTVWLPKEFVKAKERQSAEP